MTTTVSPLETVANHFNFGVSKFRLSGPDNMRTPHFGLFRSDTSECIGNAVSEKYTPHTTEDVLALVEAAGHAFDQEFSVRCHWNEGHHVIIEPTREHRIAVYGTADNIFPRFGISAGFDGRAFHAFLGMYRDVCRNMARLQTVNECNASIRHTKNLRSRMDDLIQVFQGLKSSWGTVAEVVARMQAREVSLADFLNSVYGDPATIDTKRGLTLHRERTEEIFRRVQAERYSTGRPTLGADFKVSAWEAYNAVQGYVQHCTNRRSASNNDFDRILLASRSTDVLKAEKLALAI